MLAHLKRWPVSWPFHTEVIWILKIVFTFPPCWAKKIWSLVHTYIHTKWDLRHNWVHDPFPAIVPVFRFSHTWNYRSSSQRQLQLLNFSHQLLRFPHFEKKSHCFPVSLQTRSSKIIFELFYPRNHTQLQTYFWLFCEICPIVANSYEYFNEKPRIF